MVRVRIVVGAGALVHRDGKLLLLKRAEEPDRGMWSFPGGMVEVGETAMQAAAREVREETGLDVEVEGLFEVVTYMPRREGRMSRYQVVVIDYLAKPRRGRPRLNAESSDYGWFAPAAVQSLRTTPETKACARKFAAAKVR